MCVFKTRSYVPYMYRFFFMLYISESNLFQQYCSQQSEYSDGLRLIFVLFVVQIRLSIICFGASQILQVFLFILDSGKLCRGYILDWNFVF